MRSNHRSVRGLIEPRAPKRTTLASPADRADRNEVNSQVVAELTRLLSARTVIVGVGSSEHGDDGFGPVVASHLRRLGVTTALDTGTCPENYLGAIVALRPQVVLVLDAAEMDRPPGSLMLCDPGEVTGGGLSSHAGSLDLLARYVCGMTDAACRFLLVQPQRSGWTPDDVDRDRMVEIPFSTLSRPVRAVAHSVCRVIMAADRERKAASAAVPHVS